jgi:hypothetical protein
MAFVCDSDGMDDSYELPFTKFFETPPIDWTADEDGKLGLRGFMGQHDPFSLDDVMCTDLNQHPGSDRMLWIQMCVRLTMCMGMHPRVMRLNVCPRGRKPCSHALLSPF